MNGKLPSTAQSPKRTKTLLNVCWLPTDAVLMDALRPYKARSRGRRLKELALLGAELERLGFRLESTGTGYRVMHPANLDAGVDAAAWGPVAGSPVTPAPALLAQMEVEAPATGPTDHTQEPLPVVAQAGFATSAPHVAPEPVAAIDDHDALAFAANF
ncbi:hypothetical protein [Pseudoxanthomonas japonensis]|uniref:hypothetical protein n=1 Tax=Pseudoxanthomonas japonensis TaxID=69284 RepID=UPI0037480AF6